MDETSLWFHEKCFRGNVEKENNVSRILSDSITDNNLADDLIFESIDLFNYVFKNNLNGSFTLIQYYNLDLF